ncbi:CRIB domain-containing protein RIC6 [Cajanus cajan]|uniref:CRIB domain-containing protein RIC6 n=1 Tax=Cajanus cajan TaxID=3821 RepID=UPI00098D92AF|nr:CRIB domain-containing protein RIC6 [Cajanus cajan]
MSTKVKGLLKGLKHISQQIFDEKEEEFQIGLPTDVKHVAHIGSDDPSANAPSWMTEYKGGKEPPSGNAKEGENDSSQNSKGTKSRHLLPKSRHHSSESESNGTKQRTTRRHQRSSDPTADSSSQESSTDFGSESGRGPDSGIAAQ